MDLFDVLLLKIKIIILIIIKKKKIVFGLLQLGTYNFKLMNAINIKNVRSNIKEII